jgi:hypothetical protein
MARLHAFRRVIGVVSRTDHHRLSDCARVTTYSEVRLFGGSSHRRRRRISPSLQGKSLDRPLKAYRAGCLPTGSCLARAVTNAVMAALWRSPPKRFCACSALLPIDKVSELVWRTPNGHVIGREIKQRCSP